jgi:hypothetical protein
MIVGAVSTFTRGAAATRVTETAAALPAAPPVAHPVNAAAAHVAANASAIENLARRVQADIVDGLLPSLTDGSQGTVNYKDSQRY